jgi:hypothetical protein
MGAARALRFSEPLPEKVEKLRQQVLMQSSPGDILAAAAVRVNSKLFILRSSQVLSGWCVLLQKTHQRTSILH